MQNERVDVLIIGSGLSGLMTALHLPETVSVLMISKGDETQTNSYLAQGGVAAVVSENDSPKAHYEDTMACGHFANTPHAVMEMVYDAPEIIEEIAGRYGVAFDKDEKGYLLAMEGAHSKARILRMGDYTGRALVETLYPQVMAKKNVRHEKGLMAVSLMTDGGVCYGAWVIGQEGPRGIYAKTVVMATGGVGQLFNQTTNALGVAGDAIAMALRCDLKLSGLSKLQFHPTSFYGEGQEGRNFLISEAVRGEGAKLYNHKGERFMLGLHEKAELAPRDVVTRAIYSEMAKEGTSHVWLDVTHLSDAFLKERFPTIYKHLEAEGIHMAKDLIPCVPSMHYFMGGIEASSSGQTNLSGCYAIGECAHTGVHGNNRLASNSLLEILVFSKKLSKALVDYLKVEKPFKGLFPAPVCNQYGVSIQSLKDLFEGFLSLRPDLGARDLAMEDLEKLLKTKKRAPLWEDQYFSIENALLIFRAMMADKQLKEKTNDQSLDGRAHQRGAK